MDLRYFNKKLLLLLVLSIGSFGQVSLNLRYGAGPKVTVCGASNTTPIVIQTCTDNSGSAWFTPGQIVWIWGIDNNWNSDGTRRIKAVVDNTHYSISYCGNASCTVSGADAAGNGTFAAMTRIGAWIGSTVAYPIVNDPIGWFDGPSGSITARVKGTAGSPAPRAIVGFAPWDSLTSWLDGNIGANYIWSGTNYALLRGGSFGGIGAMALAAYGDTTRADNIAGAISWIDNVERFGETTACNEAVSSCGDATNMDYTVGYFMTPNTVNFTLMKAAGRLTGTQITNYYNQMLNDRTDGATCTNQYFSGTGVVTTSVCGTGGCSANAPGGGVMTGSGTTWNTPGPQQLLAGYVINVNNLGPKTIISVDSDTQIHYRQTAQSGDTGLSFSGQTYSYLVAPPWQNPNCGIVFFGKHSGYSPLSPNGAYPTAGGVQLPDLFGNQFETKTAQMLLAGLVTANGDPRGARLAEGAANWFNDVGFPLYSAFWTGPTQIDSQYGPDRFGEFTTNIVWSLYNATSGAVNYLGDRWLKDREMWNLYNLLPTSVPGTIRNVGYGTSNLALTNWTKTADMVTMPTMTAGSNEAEYMKYFRSPSGPRGDYDSADIKVGACYGCEWAYSFSDPLDGPGTNYTTLIPSARAFIYRNAAANTYCPTCSTSVVVSRTGSPTAFTDPNGSLLWITAVGVERTTNHWGNLSAGWYNPGGYFFYKHHYLLADDIGTGVQDASGYFTSTNGTFNTNYFEIGGTNTLRQPNGLGTVAGIGVVNVSRYADGGTGVNMNKYMYTLVNAAGAYLATDNITSMNRHFFHFKTGQEYLVVADDNATSTPQMERAYFHFPNNLQTGEGNTTYSQVGNSVSSLDAAGGSRMNAFFMFPGPAGFTYEDNANGSYTGGFGQTARVSACIGTGVDATGCDATATAGEIVAVYQPSMNQALTMPTVTQLASTNFRVVQINDPSTPKVACWGKAGSLYNGTVSFTTTFTGNAQLLCDGFQSGTWNVTVNGVVVTGSPFTVGDNDNSIYLDSVASGPTVFTQSGAAGNLVVTPNSLSYSCTVGGANPATQNINISATGVTLDNWSATKTQSWLSFVPTNGVAAGNSVVSANCTGLSVGTYNDTITVSSTTAGIVNSPQLVGVTLSVNPISSPVSITTNSLPDGVWLNTYPTQTLASTGGTGPYTYAITSGALPNGMTLSVGGVVSGLPSLVGNYVVGITATDSLGATSPEKSFGFNILGVNPNIVFRGIRAFGGLFGIR